MAVQGNGSTPLPTDPLYQLLLKGQDLYRQQRYEDALECFNTLENEYADPPMTLLDNRAATWEKLQKPHRALRDGQTMIQMARDDSTGYLRTGKILIGMEKEAKALEIYRSGLRHVSSDSDGGKMLHHVANKLALKLAVARAKDPLTMLPLELAQRIFGGLDLRDIVRMLRVSKPWNQFVTSNPLFWRRLEFVDSRARRITKTALKRYFKNSAGQATHLIVRARLPFSLFAPNLLPFCKKLQHLELNIDIGQPDILTDFVLQGLRLHTLKCGPDVKLDARQTWKMLRSVPTLRWVEFHGLVNAPSARSMQEELMRADPGFADLPPLEQFLVSDYKDRFPNAGGPYFRSWSNLLAAALPRLANLRYLCLENISITDGIDVATDVPEDWDLRALTKLQRIRINRLDSVQLLCPSSVTDIEYAPGGLGVNLQFEAAPNLNLRRLVVRGNNIPRQCVQRFLNISRIGSLQELVVTPAHNLSPDYLTAMLKDGKFDNLCTLELSEGPINDAVLQHIAKRCLKLTKLRLPHSAALTGVGVKALVLKAGTKLEELHLRDCPRLTGDAVGWARAQGVCVYVQPSQEIGSQRLYLC